MFRPNNGYTEIHFFEDDIPKNNTILKSKNGYADINIDKEYTPEIPIYNNTLARFCASMNQVFFINPLDPDYEDRYTDKFEQIIKNKNLNDISFDFECPNKITSNTCKPKQVSYLNLHSIIYFLNFM